VRRIPRATPIVRSNRRADLAGYLPESAVADDAVVAAERSDYGINGSGTSNVIVLVVVAPARSRYSLS
jgi:hypothetical protein